jgi:RNA polymerase sigma-70 factor (ECF subfamily)
MAALAGTSVRFVARASDDALSLALDRNAAWFGELYEATIDSVYRYAFTLTRDANRAEDLAADAYLKAWHGRSSLRDDARALPWLMSITHNLAISQMRGFREVADVSLLSEHEDRSADPTAALVAESEAASLQAAMRQLTPEQQQVLFLRFFEGLAHESVAQRLGRTPNAIRAIQFRALSRLRKLLEDHVAEAI